MLIANASMSDVLSASTHHDSTIVLPTLDHALFWWPKIQDMIENQQPINKTKTAIYCQKSNILLRLWTPYEREPTQPMDYVHAFVFHCDYLLLYGLTNKGVVKWMK